MGRRRQAILVVSSNPGLADVRKQVLEAAGYKVLAASNLPAVTDACRNEKIDLIMLGYSLPPAERRRVWVEARQHCKAPILELYEGDRAELMEETNTFVHESHTPGDFLEAAEAILRRR